MANFPSKAAARKTRDANRKTPSKGRGKTGNKRQKAAPKLATEIVRNTRRENLAPFEQFRASQVPDSVRVLAESNVVQTRELYERSKSTVQAVLESWQKSFGAFAQGAVGLNRTLIDSAERNIDTAFDFATDVAGARNFAEVVELQAAYWRKVLGDLRTHQGARGRSPKARVPTRNR